MNIAVIQAAGAINPVYHAQKTQKTASKTVFACADTLEISQNALPFAEILKAASASPDLRRDCVDTLREQVTAGRYLVPGDKIADAFLQGVGALED